MFFQYYEELELGNISRLRPFEETLRHGLQMQDLILTIVTPRGERKIVLCH